ncbi:MAG: glycosyltransferase [Pirellulaceae bacterium]
MRNHADQIIVVDGGSTDQTVQVAQSFPVYVVQAKKGATQLNVTGVEHATNEVILFLHADNVLSDGCLHQIRSELSVDAGSQIAGGGFRQRIEHHGSVFRLIEAGNAWRADRLGLYYGDQAIFVQPRAGGDRRCPRTSAHGRCAVDSTSKTSWSLGHAARPDSRQ